MGRDPLDYLGVSQATIDEAGKVELATNADAIAGTSTTLAITPAALAAVAIAGAPDASEVVKGIAQLATTAETTTGTNDTDIVTPLKLTNRFASPPAMGGTTAGAGTFTDLTADGTGTVTLTSNAASVYDVTGAGNDLTLSSDAGRVIVNGEEAAANAITLLSAAGGIDADAALQINIASSQNAADALRLSASAGGIDVDAVGAAGEDINITNTGGSIVLSATENAADSITITSTAGGIDVTAAGASGEDLDLVCTSGSANLSGGEDVADAVVISAGAGGIDILATGEAGQDIDIVNTGGSLNLSATESAVDAITIDATLGGIDITASGAAAGEDIDITATGSSVNITSTEDVADSIVISSTNGGIDITAAGAAAGEDIDITATGSSINLSATESAVDAITIDATLGGIDITASGAAAGEDIDITATGSSVNITSTENVADSIVISSTNGGIDITAAGAAAGEDIDITATGSSINLSATESANDAITIDATAGGIDITASGAAAGEDIDIVATGSSVNIQATEADGAAITINASNAAGGMLLDSGGVLELNSSAGVISIGNDAVAQNINIGTGAAARTITMGNTTGASGLVLQAGTGEITMTGTVKEIDAEFLFSSGTDLTVTQSPLLQSNATTGAAPTGANGDVNLMYMQDGGLVEQFIIGTQTIIAPRMTSNGLNLALDQTNAEGAEYNFGARNNAKHAFTIGTSAAFFIEATIYVEDISGCAPLMVGFRKVEANNATIGSYTDYACIGINTATSATNVVILDELNGGGQTATDTTDAWGGDTTAQTVKVLVSAAGVTTFEVGGSAASAAPAFTFDNTDVVMPFIHFLHGADVAGEVSLQNLKIGFQA